MAIVFSTGQSLIASTSAVSYGRDFAYNTSLPDALNAAVQTPCLSLYNGGTELNRWTNNRISSNTRLPPSLFVSKNAANTNANENPFPFDTVFRDTASAWNNSTRRYTIPIAGWYRISVTSLMIPNAVLSPLVNGGQIFNGIHTTMNISYMTYAFEYTRNCVAGDFIQCYSWSGGGVYGYAWTYMCIDYIG